nr:tyrosine-type recombinase/integrase [Marinobacter sp.]
MKRAVLAELFDVIEAERLRITGEAGKVDERALMLSEYRKTVLGASGSREEVDTTRMVIGDQLERKGATEDEGRYVFNMHDTEFLPAFEEWSQAQASDKDTSSRIRKAKQELTRFMGGTFFVQQVTAKKAREFLASLSGAKSTKKTRQQILSRFWTYLVESEVVAVNPWMGLKVEGDKGSSFNTRPFEDYELVKLLQTIKDQPDHWRDLCIIAMVTGARLEEIAQLGPEDVFEYDDGFILTMEKGKTDGETKRIPVFHPAGCEVLRRRKVNIDHLFPECEPQGEDTRRSKYFSKRFSEWKTKQLKFGKDVNFHSFRRYLARHFRQTVKDAPPIVGKAFLGHKIKDVDMTFGLYAGAVSVSELAIIAKRLNFPEPVEAALAATASQP